MKIELTEEEIEIAIKRYIVRDLFSVCGQGWKGDLTVVAKHSNLSINLVMPETTEQEKRDGKY